ncbi:hypothetical protein C8J56DRAFT_1165343 [Mycena floridula]|nr:hypothetical protein C8J56DRAFT_1165343 [Mycena floridula]
MCLTTTLLTAALLVCFSLAAPIGSGLASDPDALGSKLVPRGGPKGAAASSASTSSTGSTSSTSSSGPAAVPNFSVNDKCATEIDPKYQIANIPTGGKRVSPELLSPWLAPS